MFFNLRSQIEVPIFMPSLAPNDAMATHVISLRDAINAHGLRSTIYADDIKAEMKSEAKPFRQFKYLPHSQSRYLLYQAATGSNLVRHLVARSEPLMIQFHNITPRSQFVAWEPGISSAMAWGRRQLETLSRHVELALAISPFNARDLINADYSKIVLSPPLIRELPRNPGSRFKSESRTLAKLLCVGRIVPNKAQEDLLRALAIYNATFEPKAKLTFVGSTVIEDYRKYLQSLVVELGISEYVEFRSSLNETELAGLFETSQLLVSASRHEGFGFPFIESMRFGLPSVAIGTTAIPESVGDGTVLVSDNDPIAMATAWNMVLSDLSLRQRLVENGYKQSKRVDLEANKVQNIAALANLVPIEGVTPAKLFYEAKKDPK